MRLTVHTGHPLRVLIYLAVNGDRLSAEGILTESAVDALSARSLRIPAIRQHGAVVASTAGIATAIPPWIEAWRPQHIVCAYDADSAGDQAAERLRINNPRVTRQRPCGAKDWNEILVRSR